MPRHRVILAPAPRRKSTGRMVLRSSTGLRVVVPYAPRVVEVTQDGIEFVNSERPGRYPVSRIKQLKARQIQFTLTLIDKKNPRKSVWDYMSVLTKMSRATGSIAIYYTANEKGSWKMIQFSMTVNDRNEEDQPCNVTVNLTFEEADNRLLYTGPVSGHRPSNPGPPRNNPSPSHPHPAPRYYIVKAGDTLWDLARKYYGDPYKWRRIADANGITNPRRLQIGTKLRIP